jgi:uncharacterized membrane protein YgdD (TMEM256/DUF423 family)
MTTDPVTGIATADAKAPHRWWMAIGGIAGFLGVLIGAFGAHGLEDFLAGAYSPGPELLTRRLDQFDVAARYHLVHAVALLVITALPGLSARAVRITAGLMLTGIVLFSGSLYLLVATNTPWLGAITPLGGTAWLLAWAGITIAALRGR